MSDKYEVRDMTGSLFPNGFKKSETDRDHNGTIKVNGVEYWISAWNNIAQNSGNPYMKLSITPKEASSVPKTSHVSNVKPSEGDKKGFNPDDDDIPF